MRIFFLLILFITLNQDSIQDKHKLFSEILSTHIKDGLVDYKNLKNDSRLQTYLSILAKIEPSKIIDTNIRLAYWINAYNAYTLKVIIDNYPVESINDLHSGGRIIGHILGTTIWDYEFIEVESEILSLNDIEHEIIREEFKEPRIHFALVCAAISCPPLLNEAYEGYKLNEQLNEQAVEFLNDPTKNKYDIKKKEMYLSKIMDWYGDDFGEDEKDLIIYVSQFLFDNLKEEIQNNLSEWDISYLSYDWDLNIIK